MGLEAKNVSFRYHRKSPWVLENRSISIADGEQVALLAPSGYGKTTLALLLSGFLEPTAGQILLDGSPLPKTGVCPVQLILQHPEKAINPRWKLKRVLEESGEIDDALLERLGIEPAWLERFPRELSGGELQRFSVARALAAQPRFLICDEISTMLDAITQAQLWQVVLQEAEARGMGLLVVTHNPHLASKVCQGALELDKE